MVGNKDGFALGFLLGIPLPEGNELGVNDGIDVGTALGSRDRLKVGVNDGIFDDDGTGDMLGLKDGLSLDVGVCDTVGVSDESCEGAELD
mmetsp:Transcript_30968/g.92791  ORF Transcript_30968/g.92791 Transcript_30968/m.92791 type:complete len:90 (+) Transcript_30968:553-822(+)